MGKNSFSPQPGEKHIQSVLFMPQPHLFKDSFLVSLWPCSPLGYRAKRMRSKASQTSPGEGYRVLLSLVSCLAYFTWRFFFALHSTRDPVRLLFSQNPQCYNWFGTIMQWKVTWKSFLLKTYSCHLNEKISPPPPPPPPPHLVLRIRKLHLVQPLGYKNTLLLVSWDKNVCLECLSSSFL